MKNQNQAHLGGVKFFLLSVTVTTTFVMISL